jgi:hypothetical protein
MNKQIRPNKPINALRTLLVLGLLLSAGSIAAADIPELLDGFEKPGATSLDTPRLVITDAELGGRSAADPVYREGIVLMEGSIAPARGQPGFVSFVLMLDPEGKPRDLSSYNGIEMRIRVLEGSLSVLAASSEILNFDYHAAPIARSGAFEVVRIPFKSLKRVWSKPVPLNLKTVTSINFVASGMQAGRFLYEIDSVGFYK